MYAHGHSQKRKQWAIVLRCARMRKYRAAGVLIFGWSPALLAKHSFGDYFFGLYSKEEDEAVHGSVMGGAVRVVCGVCCKCHRSAGYRAW